MSDDNTSRYSGDAFFFEPEDDESLMPPPPPPPPTRRRHQAPRVKSEKISNRAEEDDEEDEEVWGNDAFAASPGSAPLRAPKHEKEASDAEEWDIRTLAVKSEQYNAPTPPPPTPPPPPPPHDAEACDSLVARVPNRAAAPSARAARGYAAARVQAATAAMERRARPAASDVSELSSTSSSAAAAAAQPQPPPLEERASMLRDKLSYVAREVVASHRDAALSGALPRLAVESPCVFQQQALLQLVQAMQQRIGRASDAHEEAVFRGYCAAPAITRAYLLSTLRTPGQAEPECSARGACFGTLLEPRNGGAGATLVAYYPPDVWAKYQDALRARRAALELGVDDEDAAEVRLPEKQGRCALCIIWDARRMHLRLQQRRRCAAAAGAAQPTPPYDHMISAEFSVLIGVPGEFRGRDCFGPSNEFASGLLAPLPKPDLYAVKRVRDPATGVVYFVPLLPVSEGADADEAAHRLRIAQPTMPPPPLPVRPSTQDAATGERRYF
jgi:hypothetical protein